MFVPAESVDDGETLWIVVGWLLLSLLTVWLSRRAGEFRWQVGLPETGVIALALAQVIAGLGVWWSGGDRRAAVNMSWEWIGVATAFVLLRLFTSEAPGRRRLYGLLLTSGVVLSGLGLWQRYIWYPQVQASYREWEELTQGDAESSLATRRRMEELQRELGPELLSLQGASQAALRQRVLDSQEPFGRFGLTNTFGGLLAVVSVLLCGCWPVRTPGARWGLIALFGVVVLTLLLTRSRTAWLAALCGWAYVGGVRWWSLGNASDGRLRFQTLLKRALIVGMALLPVGVLALALGAVDRQDLSEAPKSVLYRVQYWTATSQILREHPWLGVGPGNFRQHYLRHKLPEASEEISDPHNLFLDLWATGGLLSLAALVGVMVLAMRIWTGARAVRSDEQTATRRAEAAPPAGDGAWLGLVCVLACGVVFLVNDLFAARAEWQLGWLAAASLPAAWMADRLLRAVQHPSGLALASAGAGLTLTIHLLTSGGISMPAISLLWLVTTFALTQGAIRASSAPAETVSGTDTPATRSRWPKVMVGDRASMGLAALGLVLLVGSLATAWVPVTRSQLYLSGGRYALLIDRRPDLAVGQLELSAESDPLSPQPWSELVASHLLLQQVSRAGSAPHRKGAVEAAEAAIARDPNNPHAYRLLGNVWLRQIGPDGPADAASKAVAAFEQALERYPHSSRLWAESVPAWRAAGRDEDARHAARRALELDDINHEARHYDKTFSELERKELERMAGTEA